MLCEQKEFDYVSVEIREVFCILNISLEKCESGGVEFVCLFCFRGFPRFSFNVNQDDVNDWEEIYMANGSLEIRKTWFWWIVDFEVTLQHQEFIIKF